MTVYVRILLQVLAGYLLASGYINEEVKSLIVDDPTVAVGIQIALAAIVHAAGLAWWRIAKRLGWST